MKFKMIGPELAGTAVLGTRGQVVIPQEARKQLKLKSGESFIVLVHNEAVIFLPKKRMKAFVAKLTATLKM